jgi:DNA-binding HxlR family transcriptional regulator
MSTTTETIGCVKAATNILGDKWTPIILRHFVNQKSVRFCQVQDLVSGINPRTLSARLDSLEQAEVITKDATTSENRCEYRLTEKGEALIPILRDMQLWSEKFATTAEA